MRSSQLIFTILFLTTAFFELRADEYFRKDYSDNWFIYDKESGQFTPALGDLGQEETIHFYVNTIANQGKTLELCSNGNIALFINNAVVDNPVGVCRSLKIDSLREQWMGDSLLFTIYKVDKSASFSTSILYPALGFVAQESPIKARVLESDNDFIFSITMILLVALIIVRERDPRFFEEFTDLSKTFALRVRSSQLYTIAPYSREVISIVVIQSLAISFFIMTIGQFIPGVRGLIAFENVDFWLKIGQWALMSGILLMIIFSQYLVLSTTNIFFKNARLMHVQYYDNLRINHFYFMGLFMIILIAYALSKTLLIWIVSYLWVFIVFLFLMKSIFLYLKILNQTTHRKMHMFAYFCATEILPVAIVIKIVFV